MIKGCVPGHLKTHSLRKSTCTRLFSKDVNPQLVKEQIEHMTDAIMLYKKSNIEQKRKKFLQCLVYSLKKNVRKRRDTLAEKYNSRIPSPNSNKVKVDKKLP